VLVISKHCTCPLNICIYSFKSVKLFLKHPILRSPFITPRKLNLIKDQYSQKSNYQTTFVDVPHIEFQQNSLNGMCVIHRKKPAFTLVSCRTYFFDPEDGGDIVPPKRRLTPNGLHGVISQKIVLFRLY
jgi:hypothetical protein